MSDGLTITPGVPPHRHPAGSVTGLAAIATTGASADITDSTAAGRSLLTAVDAAAQRTALSVPSVAEVAAGYQPLDSDLTAIAALTTTSYGRSLLTGADAAATRTLLGLATVATSGSAADLTGTLADARLSANVAKLGTASQNFTNPVGFGVAPTAGEGLLQLSTGTTKANGILLGNVPVYRFQSYGLAIDTNSSAGHQVRIYEDSSSPTLAIRAVDNVYAQLLFRTYNGVTEDDRFRARADGSGLLWQTWNGSTWTDMLKVSTAGALAFYGVSGSTRQTAAAAATDAATTQTLANSLRTILINLGLAQ